MRKTTTAAKAALVPAASQDIATTFRNADRANQLAILSTVDAKQRMQLLSCLGIGQIASLIGDAVRIGSSAYEAIHLKLRSAHGNDWHAIYTTPGRDLCDADKERKKAITADLETVREGIKAGNGGDAAKAADAMRKIRDWGAGKHKSKSNANANKKQALKDHLLSWDVLPSEYRRIMNDEGADDTDMVLADAIAAWFTGRGINPKHVLECKGRSEWMK